jgi:hypothetical protein
VAARGTGGEGMSKTPNFEWKEDEVRILAENYKTKLPAEISTLLPRRTWQSIKRKADRLGLSRDLPFFLLEPRSIPMNIDHTEAAWAAGFIDGEGSISILKHKGRLSRHYIIELQASNTNAGALYRLAALFGGNVTPPTSDMRGNRKPLYHWLIASEKAASCIEALLPYLCVKCNQAQLALQLQHIIEATKTYHSISQQPLGQDELNAREFLYQKVRVLNERGRPNRSVQLNLEVQDVSQCL